MKPEAQSSVVTPPRAESRLLTRGLYLFAGPARHTGIAQAVMSLVQSPLYRLNCSCAWDEVDILRGEGNQDLTDPDLQHELLQAVAAGEYRFVFVSPPCSTWSRARHSNRDGPRPLRDRVHPLGLPRLSPTEAEQVRVGNILVFFSLAVLRAVTSARRRGFEVTAVLEHPEDLGVARHGFPASIWQLPEVRALHRTGFRSAALHQCRFGADYPKPTRLLSNAASLASLGLVQDPRFDPDGKYVGPLSRRCGHRHPKQLIGRSAGQFATAPSAQ